MKIGFYAHDNMSGDYEVYKIYNEEDERKFDALLRQSNVYTGNDLPSKLYQAPDDSMLVVSTTYQCEYIPMDNKSLQENYYQTIVIHFYKALHKLGLKGKEITYSNFSGLHVDTYGINLHIIDTLNQDMTVLEWYQQLLKSELEQAYMRLDSKEVDLEQMLCHMRNVEPFHLITITKDGEIHARMETSMRMVKSTLFNPNVDLYGINVGCSLSLHATYIEDDKREDLEFNLPKSFIGKDILYIDEVEPYLPEDIQELIKRTKTRFTFKKRTLYLVDVMNGVAITLDKHGIKQCSFDNTLDLLGINLKEQVMRYLEKY